MPLIGHDGGGGFITSIDELEAFACKFAAPSTFTPTSFFVNFSDSWGQSGDAYVAIYDDNGGVPGSKVWQGTVGYNALHNGWLEIVMSSPPELTGSTDYWLVTLFEKDAGGTFNINMSTQSSTANPIWSWTESTAGTWTDDPTASEDVSNRRMRIYATDAVDTSDERDAKIVGQLATNSERDAMAAGGDGRYVEDFSTTTKKDAGNTDAEWPGDGTARLSQT